jgi:hypothetical protein
MKKTRVGQDMCWTNISYNKDGNLFLMQRHGFKLFDLDLPKLKSSSFSVSTMFFITFQNVPFFKGTNKRLGKT